MAFTIADIHLFGQAGARNVYIYETDDDLATIEADAYFDSARVTRGIGVGDVIMVSADQDGTDIFKAYTVSQSDATNGVTLATAMSAVLADPSGGATQDAEARTAINAIIDCLQANGLMALS